MKNAVTVVAPTLPGLIPNAEVQHLANSFVIEPDLGGRTTINRYPTIVERQTLSRRMTEVERAVRPISEDLPAIAPDGAPSTDKRIAAMFLAKMFRGWNINEGSRVLDFLDHLSEHPLFAIEKACRDATSRRLTKPNGDPIDYTYPPSSSALGAAAEKHATALIFERLKIDKVLHTKLLTPPEPTQAQRDEMRGHFQALATTLRIPYEEPEHLVAEKAKLAREKAEHEHRMREEMWRAWGYEPCPNADGSLSSPSMLKSVGRWPFPGAVKIKKVASR